MAGQGPRVRGSQETGRPCQGTSSINIVPLAEDSLPPADDRRRRWNISTVTSPLSRPPRTTSQARDLYRGRDQLLRWRLPVKHPRTGDIRSNQKYTLITLSGSSPGYVNMRETSSVAGLANRQAGTSRLNSPTAISPSTTVPSAVLGTSSPHYHAQNGNKP